MSNAHTIRCRFGDKAVVMTGNGAPTDVDMGLYGKRGNELHHLVVTLTSKGAATLAVELLRAADSKAVIDAALADDDGEVLGHRISLRRRL